MQVYPRGTSASHVLRELLRREGVVGLYSGLSAGVGRQIVYSGARMGLFDAFQSLQSPDGKPLPFWRNAAAALTAGAMAAVMACPTDVSLIRMQSDATLPAAQRRGYRHLGHAIVSIARHEGMAGLYTGVGATVVRAMAANFGALTFNSEAKKWFARAGVTGDTQIAGSALCGGLASSVFGMPFDYVKTQMQRQRADPKTGVLPYRDAFDCVRLTLREGSLLRFYVGFPIYLVRIAPFQVCSPDARFRR